MTKTVKVSLLSLAVLGLTAAGLWLTTGARAADIQTADAATTTESVTATAVPSMGMADRHQQHLEAMADLLGVTAEELQTELQSGKEFYQIAASHGVTYNTLKANEETQVKNRLDDMVKVGFLTQDQADTMLQQYQTKSQEMPIPGLGGPGRGMHGGMFGL